MAETQLSSLADSIREARHRVEQELRAQAERYEKLNSDLTELRQLHEQIEQEAGRQWEEISRAAEQALAKAAEEAAAHATELANAKAAEQAAKAADEAAKAAEQAAAKAAEEATAKAAAAQISPETVLEGVLSAVRNLVTATAPDQVLQALTQEASQLGVRAAIFDVRGKAAFGTAAHGFGPALTEKVLHGLIIPLNQDSPFKQVCETAGHVDATATTLKKNRNVLDKLKPGAKSPILLLPIRSGGTVSAIFYSDPGETGETLPVNALKILAEFGGAQIDRLIALSGGFAAEEAGEEAPEAEEAEAPAAEVAPEEVHHLEPPVPAPPAEHPAVEAHAEAVEPPAPEPPPAPIPVAVEAPPAPPVVEPAVQEAPPPVSAAPPPAAAGFDVSQLSEADQKVHKDAKRFAKLLVSEIELYNKAKVADGRKNRDVYKRLKSDIDRSRQTFEKRFGKVLSKQVDYFHDELVKTLAANDPAVLGTEYPGPSA